MVLPLPSKVTFFLFRVSVALDTPSTTVVSLPASVMSALKRMVSPAFAFSAADLSSCQDDAV